MNDIEDIKYGWDFMSKILGADMGSQSAAVDYSQNVAQNKTIKLNNQHIQEINAAIDELAQNINNHPHLNLPIEQFKGFVAEEMQAGTFNIEAIRADSGHRAWTLQENGYASVDIDTNFGKSYSLKYYNVAEKAEAAQAAFNYDTLSPKYGGQERLIASEQIEEAKSIAHRRGLKDIENRPEISKAHFDTEKHLVGKVSDDNGIEAKELTINESRQIAKEAKRDGFDPEKHGIIKETLQEQVRIDYLNQAMKAGLTAATITAITQIVPELYKAIDYLIKHGEIDINGLKNSGKTIVSASGESFLRGSIAYGVEMAIQEGLLGETLQSINPSIVGVAVTIIYGTIKDSILVAAGKMTSKEMGSHFVDTLVVSSGYLVGMKLGGIIAQALFPQLPGISYAIGSLLGCSIAALYNIGKKKLISFCVDTGFSCFGLVEQNYELPDEILNKLGVSTIPISRNNVKKTNVKTVSVSNPINRVEYETVDISVIRRGVIGVNRIGYIID